MFTPLSIMGRIGLSPQKMRGTICAQWRQGHVENKGGSAEAGRDSIGVRIVVKPCGEPPRCSLRCTYLRAVVGDGTDGARRLLGLELSDHGGVFHAAHAVIDAVNLEDLHAHLHAARTLLLACVRGQHQARCLGLLDRKSVV